MIVAFAALPARAAPWQPASGQIQIALWPGAAPKARLSDIDETLRLRDDKPVPGQPWTEVEHVTRTTMTIFPPTGTNTGAAIVVFPSDGYGGLAIDLEGTEVCDWVNRIGVTCVLLKNRVPGSSQQSNPVQNKRVIPKLLTGLQDAQRARVSHRSILNRHGGRFRRRQPGCGDQHGRPAHVPSKSA